MRTKLLALGLLLLSGFAVGAEPAPLRIALVLPGLANEPGYFNAGLQALLAARDRFHAQVAYVENLKPADADSVLRTLGDDGYRYVIVMGGGDYDDQIREVAQDYPRLKFIIVSGAFTRLPNIVSVRTGHPGVPYLAGYLMAALSRSGRIGLIGGRASPPAVADHVALIAGARACRPDIAIADVYTESYDDPALGKEAAMAQIDQGVDLIFTNANTTSFGVFQAARERHIYAIGSATDQNGIAPHTILTSAEYGMDRAVTGLIALDLDRRGWQPRVYTVPLADVGLAPFHALQDRVSPAIRARLAEVRRRLLADAIRIPRSYAELAAFP